ncbi:CvpA family protein [Herpetosiphon llansteffanensis]|uniref:CvpA family protein n=1 Tax=Herpetosiphon llansteffanensis TaxID=2094568 RepID=UPI000D7BD0CE|nr:CvpA family protein [Herpetosiphon llansteffanensis]
MGLVFNVLLLGVPLGLTILGATRGIQREAMTLIGILLGALLAELWGPIWGPNNATRFNQDIADTTAWISIILLLICTIFIGYGGALLLPSRKQLALGRSRWFGAGAGLFNGILLLSLILRYGNVYNNDLMLSPWAASSRVAMVFVERFPTMLLFGVVAIAVLVNLRLLQRLIFKIHGKETKKEEKKKVEEKPADPPKPPEPKPPAPDTVNNPILRDLILAEIKKDKPPA